MVALVAGCSAPAPATLVVVVDEHFTSTGSPRADLTEGDHCIFTFVSGTHVDIDAAKAPDVLVVRRYHPAEFPHGGPRFGGGDELGDYSRGFPHGGHHVFPQSFGVAPLFTVSSFDGLWVGSHSLQAGQPYDVASTYEVEGGTYTETATITLEPGWTVQASPQPGFCD